MSKLGEHVGITASAGVVVEQDPGHLLSPDYPYYLMTDLNADAAEFAGVTETDEKVLVALAYALETGESNGYTAQPVLMTGEQAFLKPDAYADGNIAYADGDRTGPFCVAAMATGGKGGKLFYASSRQCFSDTANGMVNGMNYRLAGKLFSGLREDPYMLTAAGLQTPSMMPEQVEPEPAQRTVLMAVMIAVPVLVAAAGIVVAARFGRKPKTEKQQN